MGMGVRGHGGAPHSLRNLGDKGDIRAEKSSSLSECLLGHHYTLGK